MYFKNNMTFEYHLFDDTCPRYRKGKVIPKNPITVKESKNPYEDANNKGSLGDISQVVKALGDKWGIII